MRKTLSRLSLYLLGPSLCLGATAYQQGSPSNHEQLMLELINRARQDPGAEATRLGIDLNEGIDTDDLIADTPKPPLPFNPLLSQAAIDHTQWMIDNDIFSSTGVDGTNPQARMIAAGYVFTGAWDWGENISWGGTSGTPDLTQYTIERHESLFVNSSHRPKICNANFTEMGIGILSGVFSDANGDWNAVMVTQDYADSSSTPGKFLLGVVYNDLDEDNFYDPGEGVEGVTVTPSSGDWYAVTSASGGYAFPYTDSGDITVSFSGGSITEAQNVSVSLTGSNTKVDLIITPEAPPPPELEIVGFEYKPKFLVNMLITGDPGTDFVLEYATTMGTWVEIDSYTLSESTLTVTHQPAKDTARCYYRARRDDTL